MVDDNADDRFGFAVDVDGNRMVATAPFADVGGVVDAGRVYVYDRADADSPWVLTDTLTMPVLEAAGGFGDSVSVRGDLIAVGESDRLGDEAEPGRVWVYSFDGFVWEQLGPVLAATGSDGRRSIRRGRRVGQRHGAGDRGARRRS